jgi:hypothetical protein
LKGISPRLQNLVKKMDIEEIRKTIERLNGLMKFVENKPDIRLNIKDFEITAICQVCELREDNLTIDFMPWIEALEKEKAKNPENHEIILKRDRTLTLPRLCTDWNGEFYILPLALKSLNDEEYKNLRGEFINILDIIYHASEHLYHECDRLYDSRQHEYPLPLPYHGDVDDIGSIFGKSF